MAEYTEDYQIIGPKGTKSGNAFVDTGATFTVVPKQDADALGLTPYRTEIVDTNNGPVTWGVGRAEVSVGGKPPHEQDVFLAPSGNPLAIGASSLQISGFKLKAMSARARQSVCATCENNVHHPYLGDQCSLCGCLIKLKTMVPSSACPIGRW
jgi:predicted aspartyl protease